MSKSVVDFHSVCSVAPEISHRGGIPVSVSCMKKLRYVAGVGSGATQEVSVRTEPWAQT